MTMKRIIIALALISAAPAALAGQCDQAPYGSSRDEYERFLKLEMPDPAKMLKSICELKQGTATEAQRKAFYNLGITDAEVATSTVHELRFTVIKRIRYLFGGIERH
jgi:hypothetical protein